MKRFLNMVDKIKLVNLICFFLCFDFNICLCFRLKFFYVKFFKKIIFFIIFIYFNVEIDYKD